MTTQSSDSDSEEEWDDTDEEEDEFDEESDEDESQSQSDNDDDDDDDSSDDDDDDDDSEESGSDSNMESSGDEEEIDDDLENQDEFVDEGNMPAGVGQEQQEQDDNIQEDQEGRKRQFLQPGRNISAIICCICFCLVLMTILGVVIWLVGEDNNNENNPADEGPPPPSPTLMPTTKQPTSVLSPAALPPTTPEPPPTRFPTMSPIPTSAPFIEPTGQPTSTPSTSPTITPAPTKEVPDELELAPFADTTIFKDGVNDLQFESFGSDDTMLVQDGLASKNEIPDAYFVFAFDMAEVPTFDRVQDRTATAILELTHIPTDLTRDAAILHLVRLPSTRFAIETLHSGIFVPSGGIEGPEFLVSPSAETVSIDISSLVFDTPIEDDQLFLMVENRGPEQEAGDRFKSRESDSPPKLLLYFVKDGEPLPMLPPTISPAPTKTPRPTMMPSLSVAPTQTIKPSFRTTSPIPTGNPSTPEIEI